MRSDPFVGYSLLLRTIVFGLVPALTILQFIRLRRALHVFQLEGYKRARFLAWCRANRERARWLKPVGAKKQLVMTGRAWRILITALLLTPVLILAPAGLAHVALGGWPMDVLTWALVTVLSLLCVEYVLVAADVLMAPVQGLINRGFERRARAHLRAVDPVVVGVTGSFGKTSTKFAIEQLVGPPGSALATPNSFNTPLGIVRTINERLIEKHRFFVVEMGAYSRGEIAALCRFVGPRYGVLTSIGPAHLERFGSLEDIRRAKYEIVESLPPGGTAIMNTDDPEVRALADATDSVTVVRYGLEQSGSPNVSARDVVITAEGTRLTITDGTGEGLAVTTRLLGRHSIGHVLAGVAVAGLVGRRLEELQAPIAALQPVEHRLQLIPGDGGITVIDDAYNSNPSGAAAALEVLEAMPGARKVVVTPGIIELGPLQFEENERFGERAAQSSDALIVVAHLNRDAIVSGASRVPGAEIVTVDNLAEATRILGSMLKAGDVVLFENDLPDQYEG